MFDEEQLVREIVGEMNSLVEELREAYGMQLSRRDVLDENVDVQLMLEDLKEIDFQYAEDWINYE